jgi:TolB-like protein/class 3 adenylate cyclase
VQPSNEQRVERRLAAIFAPDVAGYSRLMSQDEAATLRALAAAREVMDGLIRNHGGRIANTAGDSVLAEFPSAVDAVQCAVAVQEKLVESSAGLPEDRRLQFRIGIHVGDVVVRGGDLLGEGVNVAARLEGLAEPGGIAISGAAHGYVRKALPLTYTDLGEQHVKNIDEPVRAYSVGLAVATAPRPSESKPLPLPDKPSIAVLPFTNMSGDPEQEYFADGVVEEIITALSRFRWLFVIARGSSFAYKAKPTDVKQVGRELGIRYVLEGSFRRAAGRVRITGQLIEASTGHQVWGDRFEGGVEDLFALQDELTSSVVGALAPRLEQAEIERVRRKPTGSLDAYENYLRGLAGINRGTKEGFAEALPLLYRAIELDPQFASAHGVLAETHTTRIANGWMLDPDKDVPEALRLARKGIELDRNDPVALTFGGHVLAYIGHEFENGAAFIRQALELNPNFAAAWDFLGFNQLYQGYPAAAIEHQSRAIRLSPLDPRRGFREACIGYAHLIDGRFDEAALWARAATRNQPHFLAGHRVAAASNALAGRMDEAHAAISALGQADPTFRLSNMWTRIPFRRAEDRARLEEGLRKAGLPE